MSYLNQIAFYVGRRDEKPNQALARLLAERQDDEGVQEIVAHLQDVHPSVRSDCIKVLYEIGYLAPALIAPYAQDFIDLLGSEQNRMVWGGMIALSTIAALVPESIWPQVALVKKQIAQGTVITNVAGVKVLIGLAEAGDPYYAKLIDELLHLQSTCRTIDFAKRAEEMHVVISDEHKATFVAILQERLTELSPAAQKRVKRILHALQH